MRFYSTIFGSLAFVLATTAGAIFVMISLAKEGKGKKRSMKNEIGLLFLNLYLIRSRRRPTRLERMGDAIRVLKVGECSVYWLKVSNPKFKTHFLGFDCLWG